MTRKRAQPDARRKRQPARGAKAKPRRAGVARRFLRIAGALVARHPSVAGGSAAFLVVFAFVAANAIWYQPGAHPHPFFKTRDVGAEAAAARRLALLNGGDGEGAGPGTTYRIERESDLADTASTASIPVPAAPPVQPAGNRATPNSIEAAIAEASRDDPQAGDGDTGSAPTAAQDDAGLVASIQTELAVRKTYDGPVDGLMGPKTENAIRSAEARLGLQVTGVPSARLLAALKTSALPVAARPAERPYDLNAKPKPEQKGDAIAALLRRDAAGRPSGPLPPAEIGGGASLKASGDHVPSDLVRQIQQGLSNLAYADVAIDGVAGAQTKAAIRHFEKHYRLPETGEPSRRVLDKLVSIGAL